ncbi:MAG: DNA mismatch repair endonuclease MutL [Myxococcaceae bacterium]
MGRIAILQEALINQIAAGEVVERPASVLKELLENALDAGATSIHVSHVGGASGRLVVVDDGHGMTREDAAMALLRHATSKLRDAEGLNAIETMGFRGEALAAIAAVSRMTLSTAAKGASVGTTVECVGGGALELVDAPPRTGTTVCVEDLFFNVPARRKFLKQETTEKRHLEETLWRVALGHLETAFSFERDGERIFDSPADGVLLSRAALALGEEVQPHALAVEEARLGVHVSGFVCAPEHTLSTARGLMTFVNGRYVRDRALISAIQRAFGGALPPGRQPVAVIQIAVEPREVDVNVHPQKLEVRFADSRGVADAVHAGVRRALESAPWRSRETHSSLAWGVSEAPADYAAAVERFLERSGGNVAGPLPEHAAFGLLRPDANVAAPKDYFSRLRWVGLLGEHFWICEREDGGLCVLDAHGVYERIHLETLRGLRLQGGGVKTVSSFAAASVELTLAKREVLMAQQVVLEAWGVVLETFGGQAIRVCALPLGLGSDEAGDIVSGLAERLAGPNAVLAAEAFIACRAAPRSMRNPAQSEVRQLLSALDAAPYASHAQHPHVIALEVSGIELRRRVTGQ